MRLIDADALSRDLVVEMVKCIISPTETKGSMSERIQNRIYAAPTIDAVPVVRCGECKHSELCFFEDNGITKIEQHKCLHHRMGVNILEHDDYCSYGERQEVDGDGS